VSATNLSDAEKPVGDVGGYDGSECDGSANGDVDWPDAFVSKPAPTKSVSVANLSDAEKTVGDVGGYDGSECDGSANGDVGWPDAFASKPAYRVCVSHESE
jgi:hypothetical protein